MTDAEFKEATRAIAFSSAGAVQQVQYYALSNDELAVYIARPRLKSPGVIILHRNGTWRYDPHLPENDPMIQAKKRTLTV